MRDAKRADARCDAFIVFERVTDERMSPPHLRRYTSSASSDVHDGMRKHSPCPLITTTGAQRNPGVQVRLVAESPKVFKRSHLNPRFKVVFAGIAMAEDVFFYGARSMRADVRRLPSFTDAACDD